MKELIELTVAWLNSKPVSCKMHAFFSKMQLVSNRCTAVSCEPISKLYIYKNSAVYFYDCWAMFLIFFKFTRATVKPLSFHRDII